MEAAAPTQSIGKAQTVLKEASGKWFVNFFWRSLIIPPGFLYAIPILDFYLLLSMFSQNPALHRMTKKQVIILIALNVIVIFAFLVLIFLILQVLCDPWSLTGLGIRFAGLVNKNYDFCGALSN